MHDERVRKTITFNSVVDDGDSSGEWSWDDGDYTYVVQWDEDRAILEQWDKSKYIDSKWVAPKLADTKELDPYSIEYMAIESLLIRL